jgi:hypothetical protein
MKKKEISGEFDIWKGLWGSIGVWFGDPALGIRVVLAVSVIFSLVDWVSIYEFFYGNFSYDHVVNFSRVDKIQKYSYLYEKKAIAFSSIMTTIFMYVFYPAFCVVAICLGVKNGLPLIYFTSKRIFSIPCFCIFSVAIVYWVSDFGFEGPSRFFGSNLFTNNYFIVYEILYFLIMYMSTWIGFIGVWLFVSAIKAYLFD